MSKRVTFAKAGACALAGAIALAAAAPVQAQPAPSGSYTARSPDGYYYDACKREQTGRGTVGAVLGGGAGAVIGSNVAARNARTEGALLGGLLGAIAGGVVGNKSAACTSDPNPGRTADLPPPAPLHADGRDYDHDSNGARDGYYDRDAYADSAAAQAQARDDAYAYGQRGERYRLSDRTPGPDGCTLAESPIYMPDGRTQTRFVRVCRDANGGYAVVD
ncbi:glycine zipper 2TM domain-containing protein [Phenylobacterium sp.]|uniref:glycine zipper 2TM domain-containing protein n=1 Tax=Phenylobacterium sp. TaxID=1871053 RepID=UPI0025DAA90F|nr:glycine zipper 2TM domain-containing protein [Phenylobacterium sp.]